MSSLDFTQPWRLLATEVDGTTPTTTTGVNQTDHTSQRADTGWTVNLNTVQFTGTPDHIEFNVNLAFENENAGREAPIARFQRANGLAWDTLVIMATGYVRNATGHNDSSLHCQYTDHAPGTNPEYRIVLQRGGAASASVIDLGTLRAKAWL